MIQIGDLPRDENGIVQGVWRLVHEQPTFGGGIGPYEFRDGVCTQPIHGRGLRLVVANYGGELYIEPWDEPLPSGFALPELVERHAPAEMCAHLKTAPWRDAALRDQSAHSQPEPVAEEPADVEEPAEAPRDLDAMGLEELRELAGALDIEVDGRWGARKLRRSIRRATRGG